jgi:hypothetical protein
MRRLDRRIILQGFGGALIGLPLLEYTHRVARADGLRPPPRRFVVFFEHGGTLSPVSKTGHRFDGTGAESAADGWSPLDPGEALVPGPILQALNAHLPSLLLLRGVDNGAGRRQTPQDGDHGFNNVTALTCADATVVGQTSEDQKSANGPSIDRVLAERLALRHPVPHTALHLMVDGYHYGTPFFKGPHQPVAAQKDPVAAFGALFSGVSEGGSTPDPAAARAWALRRSILDGTTAMTRGFKAKLGAADQQTVEAHLDHLRELELRLQAQALPRLSGCQKPVLATPFANPDELGKAQVDVMLAALRCGLTNVACLELGDLETLWMSPAFVSQEGNAHAMHHLSMGVGQQGTEKQHHAAWVDTMIQNRRWRLSVLARFLDGLSAIPEGLGTMLDGTVVLSTSEFSNGGAHSGADVPLLLAGGPGGRLRGGRHLNFNVIARSDPASLTYETQASLHNVYTALLNLFDYPDTHFGNGDAYVSGPLSGLTG